MTATVLKQDPKAQKVQKMLFIRIRQSLQIFGVIPLSIKLQNDTWQFKFVLS